jgi:hypothetical protein
LFNGLTLGVSSRLEWSPARHAECSPYGWSGMAAPYSAAETMGIWGLRWFVRGRCRGSRWWSRRRTKGWRRSWRAQSRPSARGRTKSKKWRCAIGWNIKENSGSDDINNMARMMSGWTKSANSDLAVFSILIMQWSIHGCHDRNEKCKRSKKINGHIQFWLNISFKSIQ